MGAASSKAGGQHPKRGSRVVLFTLAALIVQMNCARSAGRMPTTSWVTIVGLLKRLKGWIARNSCWKKWCLADGVLASARGLRNMTPRECGKCQKHYSACDRDPCGSRHDRRI